MDVKLQIQKDAVLHVSEGQKVKIGDPFYSIKKTEELSVPVAEPLGVKPQLIFQYSQVVIGSDVAPGDILASIKKFIGSKKVASTVQGTVLRIDHEEGIIVLNTSSDKDKNQPCFFSGTITSIDKKKSRITLTVGNGISVDAEGVDKDGGGDVTLATSETYFSLTTDEIQGNALLIHDCAPHMFTKFDALDAGGVIYVTGETSSDIPRARVTEKAYEALTKKTYDYIVFSSHEKKVFAYN